MLSWVTIFLSKFGDPMRTELVLLAVLASFESFTGFGAQISIKSSKLTYAVGDTEFLVSRLNTSSNGYSTNVLSFHLPSSSLGGGVSIVPADYGSPTQPGLAKVLSLTSVGTTANASINADMGE